MPCRYVWFGREIARGSFQCPADMCGLVERLSGIAFSAVQIWIIHVLGQRHVSFVG